MDDTVRFYLESSLPCNTLDRMNKRALVERIVEALRAELATAERVARETADAANHPEARPENDKDTRKIELSYLAAGQATRARDLEVAIHLVGSMPLPEFRDETPIGLGAIASLETDGKPQRVFLCAAGGGMTLDLDGAEVRVVTIEAPLGKGLLGRTVGESFELLIAGKPREVEVRAVE
ncbi:MAG TPA: hypothetical protein VHE30_12540 [Polyangiaceae bacterium]|nr:hypothetical protein [Polyangiaceae bacterium]